MGIVDVVAEAGSLYELHPLVMEDILNIASGEIDVHDYASSFEGLHYGDSGGEITAEQVSIVLKGDTVIASRDQGDDFLPVIDRIINDRGRIRKLGTDFPYAIIDSIVDNYFGA